MFRHTSRLQFESQPDPVYAPCLTKKHIRERQILPDLEKHMSTGPNAATSSHS
jgi:hypothetical protein